MPQAIVTSGAVPYLTADVYQRSYTFVADKAWTGNFVVRVTPYNTNDDPNQADNFNTSAVQTFMHALPTPEIEFRLVKRENGGFDWNQCQTPDEKSREFKYEVVAVLKNYTEYPTDEAWTVKLTDGKAYLLFQQTGWQAVHPPDPKFGTHFDAYGAGNPGQQQQYKVSALGPVQVRDLSPVPVA